MKLSKLVGLGLTSLAVSSLVAATAISQTFSDRRGVATNPAAASKQNLKQAKKAIAKVELIEARPVLIKPSGASRERPARVGMNLRIADVIRTARNGRTQVEFDNGVAFRIGGNSILEIQPQNQLKFNKGNMITWVKPGRKVPAKIITPVATAAIRGTTAFVEIPEDVETKGIRIFSWEGDVAVSLNSDPSQEVLLTTGEELIIMPDATELPPVRRLSMEEWQNRIGKADFLHSFDDPLPTLPTINQLLPGQSSPEDPVPGAEME
ncbi:FecR family protein [Thalassoporum mexicanum PCC 7367]|uniref:FecR family protein n=1 Tax=Thalassoporum mexicanum TaxID=3457544 RepID=UPI00029FBA1F|nr:FecR family protein [Pseudanabaena sp. PCC 7367]AFY68554.1 FecR family protein [Pseudanabaena sp. PCC 7367]